MSALDYLRERNTHEVKLESGLIVTIELQQLAELLLAGDVPLPVLAKMNTAREAGDLPDLLPEELRLMREFNINAAAGAIRKVAEYEVPEDQRREVVLALADDEFNELVAYATRGKDPQLGEA